jgi:protein-tyrosine-phosphatase
VREAERVPDLMRSDVQEQLTHEVVREGKILSAGVRGAGLHNIPVPCEVHHVMEEADIRIEDLSRPRITDVGAIGVLDFRR